MKQPELTAAIRVGVGGTCDDEGSPLALLRASSTWSRTIRGPWLHRLGMTMTGALLFNGSGKMTRGRRVMA
jgi:hypothetical protein